MSDEETSITPPSDPAAERRQLMHDVHNALAAASDRLQLVQRRLRRGEIEPQRAIADLEVANQQLRRVASLVATLDFELALLVKLVAGAL